MKVKVTVAARKSLKSIEKYTAENWGATQKRKYLKALYDRFNYLAKHPKRGKPARYIAKGLHSYTEGSHIIYYRTKKSHIEIIDILHERMEPRRHLD